MDYYFTNNLPMQDFLDLQTWKFIGQKYASYWFNEKEEKIEIQFLEKSNKTFLKFNIIDDQITFDNNNSTLILRGQANQAFWGVAFKSQDHYLIYKHHYEKFSIIQKRIDQSKHVQFNQNRIKEYVQIYIDQQNLNAFEMLPLILQVKSNQQFVYQFQEWINKQLDDENLDILTKKKLFYFISQTFQLSSKNYLKQMLLNEQNFKFIKDLILKFHKIFYINVQECNYEKFEKDCFQLLEQRILKKVRKERIDYAVRLRYLLQTFFKHLMTEKYLQIYQKMADKNQHQIFCQVLKNDQNVKIIVTQIEKKQYQRFDFLVELLYSFDKHLYHFDRAISFLNQYLFMNFLRRILQKIEFINDQNQMIIKIRCKYFGIYDKFRKFLEFIALFIQRNPICFVNQIFPVNQRQEHYKSLKCIISLFFQSNYQNLEYISFQVINNILNNILRLTEDQQDYFELVGNILIELFQEFKFLKFKTQTLKILDFLIQKNHKIVLEKVLQDSELQEHLVDTLEYSKVKVKIIFASRIICYLINDEQLRLKDTNVEIKLRRHMMNYRCKNQSMMNLQLFKLKIALETE